MERVEIHQIIPLCSASNYAIRFSNVYSYVRGILNIPYNSVPFVFRYYPGAVEKVVEATYTNGTVRLSIIKYTNSREELFNELELKSGVGSGMFKNTEFSETFFYFDKDAWLHGKTRVEYTFSSESSEEEKNIIKEGLYCDSDKYIIPRNKVILNTYQHGNKRLCILSENLCYAIKVKAEGENKNYANELCSLFSLANKNQFELEHAKSELRGATQGLRYFHRFYFSSDVYKLKTVVNYLEEEQSFNYYLLHKQEEMEKIDNMFSGRIHVFYRCESCIPREEFQNVWNDIKIVRDGNEIVIRYKENGDEENHELSGYPTITLEQARQIMGLEPNIENEVIDVNRVFEIEIQEFLANQEEEIPRNLARRYELADIINVYKRFEVFLYKDSFRYLGDNFIDESCQICLIKFNDEDVVKMFFCGKHIFHKNCIKRWVIEGSVVCPICRHNMFDGRLEETGTERKITNYLRNKRYLDEPDEEN